MRLVDSHCHLNFSDFAQDLDAVVERAREAGVVAMQTICTEMEEFEEVYALTQRFPDVFCSVGVHPNDSGKEQAVVSAEALVEKTRLPKVIGIGETGLDYYYEHTDRERQKESFITHIEAAQETGLPLIVHTRDAEEDTIALLTAHYRKKPFKGLIHCFTSSAYLAEKALEIDFSISLSGITTFKNAQSIRDAVGIIPVDKLLIETDSPYLAPVPHRGKRNEPAFVCNVNKVAADLKQMDAESFARCTTENFFRLFDKATLPEGTACA